MVRRVIQLFNISLPHRKLQITRHRNLEKAPGPLNPREELEKEPDFLQVLLIREQDLDRLDLDDLPCVRGSGQSNDREHVSDNRHWHLILF